MDSATVARKKNQRQAESMMLARELAKIPIERYKLPQDGRKWKVIARDRMGLADFLGKHGDGDGTRIFPSIATMTQKFGWSRRKTCYLLDDLRELHLLENTPNYTSAKLHRTRVRQMNVAAFLSDGSEVQDSQSQECKIEKQECNIQGQECKTESQECNDTLHTTDTLTDTSYRHLTETQKREAKAASPVLPEWIPIEPWTRFLAHRTELKKPLTSYSKSLAIQKLAKIRESGHDLTAVIDESILNGWAGFFVPRKPFRNARSESYEDSVERIQKNAMTLRRERLK